MAQRTICKNCGHPVQLINYALGARWLHVQLSASFPSEGKGTLWEYCKLKAAEPEEIPDEVQSERSLP